MLVLHYYKSFFEQKSYELIAFQDEASFRSKFIDVLHRESKKQLRYLANIICDEHLAMKIILEKLLEHKGEYIFVGITYEGKISYCYETSDRVDDNDFFKSDWEWTHKLMLTDIEYVS